MATELSQLSVPNAQLARLKTTMTCFINFISNPKFALGPNSFLFGLIICPLFVFLKDDPQQNGVKLLTPDPDSVFNALSDGTIHNDTPQPICEFQVNLPSLWIT